MLVYVYQYNGHMNSNNTSYAGTSYAGQSDVLPV